MRLLRSSTFRLALVYMALFGTSVLLLLGFIYWSTAGYMARQTDLTIKAEITGLAERYRSEGLKGLSTLISNRLRANPTDPSIYLFADRDFRPVVGNIDRWPRVAQDADGWLNFRLGGEDERAHRARARAFSLRGGYHLLVGRDVHELETMQSVIATTLGWGLGLTVLLSLGGGAMMSRSMARRIETINETSREIMAGDLARRIPTRDSGDDFDQLSDNLNSMLDRIQGLMDGVRQVSDNIAHDLRTPLARLRSRLEALGEGGGLDEERLALVEQALAEADALLATFNALLRIARIESGARRAGFDQVELLPLVQDVAELYEPLAEERGQRFTVDARTNPSVRGDRDLLFQACANLLDNAIKYTPEGGAVAIRLSNGDSAAITVEDDGPGIPQAMREQVLQRFFRLESSRSTPGNGLGLSLVAAVARLHDARLELGDRGPGLRVSLIFGGGPEPPRG